MKPFLVLLVAALAQARPEAPGGYNYNAPASLPSSSYGAPSSSLGGHSGGHSGGHGGGLGGGHGGLGFGSGGYTGAFSSGSSSGSLGSLGSLGGLSGGAQSFSSGSSFGGSSFGGSSFGGSSFGGSSSLGGSSFNSYQQAPVISKHVYVHVAPEEPEFVRPARINAASQPRKHYKIVFIKAPTAPTPTAAQVQLPQQDEEKTIIYVLSKKQEEQPDIQVQSAQPTTPTKPEVYFIKYNTKKDSGIGLSANAGAGLSNSYGVPSGPALAPAPAHSAPSSSYGIPSAHGGPY